MKKGSILFRAGSAILLFGMCAIESTGACMAIAIVSVVVGAVIASVGYHIEKLDEGRKETNRRCEEIRRKKVG